MEEIIVADNSVETERREPRLPPHNTDAEKSVLGSALISSDAAEAVCETLAVSDFYSPTHRDVFEGMLELFKKGRPIDAITLMDALECAGKLKKVGGATYITELSLYTPTASNVQYYIDIVREHGMRRKLMTVGGSILTDAQNTEKSTSETLENAERRVFELSINKSDNAFTHISDSATDCYRKIGELIKLDGALSGINTGFADLNKLTSGLQRSDLVIVAARPSMGKTAFALNLAVNSALKGNAAVAIFSLEMSSEQLAMRIICSEAEVDMQKVKTGKPEYDSLLKISDTIARLDTAKIYIDDTAGIKVTDIRSKCRRLKARNGLDMVIIDYLQLMQSSEKKVESRVQEISQITRSLKILAREIDVPIVLLSQLSREPEKRKENPRPIMSDLRESGAIEQDADVIMMLYRPAVYGKSDDNICEVIVAKHRNGPTDTVKLAWIPEYTKFKDSTANSSEY